nr:2-amino-4-hydroxy-6-hydroxymethyldihydropteridine diphosphokinase [Oryzibacter oryziterrae]
MEAALSLGGNQGDVRSTLTTALAKLEQGGARIKRRSSDYQTPPWGKTDQPAFVNAAVIVETDLAAHALLELCLKVERELGRIRMERWGPRIIDIDVLTYGDAVIDSEDLKLPHPFIAERGFVLIPLAEIAPDLLVGGHRVADLAARFADEPIVRL